MSVNLRQGCSLCLSQPFISGRWRIASMICNHSTRKSTCLSPIFFVERMLITLIQHAEASISLEYLPSGKLTLVFDVAIVLSRTPRRIREHTRYCLGAKAFEPTYEIHSASIPGEKMLAARLETWLQCELSFQLSHNQPCDSVLPAFRTVPRQLWSPKAILHQAQNRIGTPNTNTKQSLEEVC